MPAWSLRGPRVRGWMDSREAAVVTGSVFGGIHDFFQSTLWSLIQTLGAFLLVVLWAATAYWVHKDAKRRIESRSLVWLATGLGVAVPFLGPLIYMLFRPP